MSKPRHLRFTSEDQALADLAQLRAGYQQHGQWTLPMMCRHLTLSTKGALKPPASLTPTPEQAANKAAFVDVMLATGRPPAGFSPPAAIMPPVDCSDSDVDRFEETLRALKSYSHPLVDMGRFGPVPTGEFRKLCLGHTGHHLGHLVPK